MATLGASMGRAVGVFLTILLCLGCRGDRPSPGPTYASSPPVPARTFPFAVHPLHNPVHLAAAYGPLLEHLGREMPGSRFVLEASKDYGDFENKIRSRGPAILLPNPWQALEAMGAGYTILAMAGDPEDFVGLVLVRKDSSFKRLEDLKGKVVSYPSATAVAACLLPQEAFHRAGIDPTRALVNRYVGSQESSILHVVMGLSAAGATWPPPWRAFQKSHPREVAQLRVLHTTRHLVNNAVMVRGDVPGDVQKRIREILIHLHEFPDSRRVLEPMQTQRFLPATDRDYDTLRTSIAAFEREIRPVRTP